MVPAGSFLSHIDPWCHTHIRNSVETCLIDSIPGLIDAGVTSVAIDARQKTPAYAKEMVSLYREAIRRSAGVIRTGTIHRPPCLREKNCTRGHYICLLPGKSSSDISEACSSLSNDAYMGVKEHGSTIHPDKFKNIPRKYGTACAPDCVHCAGCQR